jgi:hypothetical protein
MPENIPMSSTMVEPAATARRFRRLVTGLDEQGRSTIVSDEISQNRQVVADAPGFVVTDFWRHEEVPVDNTGPADDGLSTPLTISPPPRGSVFRVVEIPPDAEWATDDAVWDRLFHSTPSLDYAIVLSGEIWAVLDADERRMTAGDVLVQRGTRHLWSNRSNSPCSIFFVLIGGTEA